MLTAVTPTDNLCQVLTCLPEKFIVDLANGIDVVRDHTRTQQSQQFLDRIWMGFTGTNAKRQQAINASLADGVESSLRWLTELSGSLAKSNYAIVQVNDRMNQLMHNTAQVAHYAVDTRQLLAQFTVQTNARFSEISQAIQNIDLMQHGRIQFDQVFARWQAGRYQPFSLSGRCYAVLEELRWGVFGDLLRNSDTRQYTGFLNELRDRASCQMALDAQVTPLSRVSHQQWLAVPDTHFSDGLAYQGDWSTADYHPVVFATTQTQEAIPSGMPLICHAERLTGALIEEVFGGIA
ncbi:diguanylate cyclase regulator RdcB family protein [Budvicia aquatica]|uniref:Chemotaxis protein n=1 Tax=Budvicia aquatica TaxID=82979 RepID=A0A2C6DSQ8_9GAMM|nr:diguanylate cyclase regulator RdcB family protein [Budvicia aquatica]PHI32247.1 chemotaxis protein [Budvicia aquatica]VFS45163.1 Uncharacterised protein [Budvicia aquatica]